MVECDDGASAVARYAAEAPDWVLMDLEMPRMDGLSAARALKRQFPASHVVIVSNHGEEEFRHAAQELGAEGFVHKANLEALSKIIDPDANQQTKPINRYAS